MAVFSRGGGVTTCKVRNIVQYKKSTSSFYGRIVVTVDFSFHLGHTLLLSLYFFLRSVARDRQFRALPPSAPSSIESAPSSTGNLALGRRRLWSESLDTFGAARGDLSVGEIAGVQVRVEVCIGQLGSHG